MRTKGQASIGLPLEERYEVDANGCWIWPVINKGYPRVKIAGVQYQVHRLFYERYVGPIPEGLTVDHLCFVTACVNPDHLRLLTHSENAKNTRRALRTACNYGHEYTPENTRLEPTYCGVKRVCRTCSRRWARNQYKRKRARQSGEAS